MNKEQYGKAQEQYQRKDYQAALMGFTACLQDTSSPLAPGEMGLLYHKIGNCLVKLKNPAEAIQSYTQATADPSYAEQGTVECNLGMAYASLRDYDNAVRHFENAVANDAYEAPFKAYMGMGNALLKLGKSAEAGVAFREAALDEANPDPTKALLNLGVCFMALNRPADAVASYESALQFSMTNETRNKLYASLGQAYVACSQMEKAVDAFERAIADKTYFLSDSASVDYQRAIGAVAQGTSDMTQVLDYADISGLDVASDGSMIYEDDYAAQDPFYYDDGYDQNASYPGYVGAYDGDQDRFFNASEQEIEQWSRGLAKQERKRKNFGLKILVFLVVIIVLAFAGAVFAYTQGYGYPTQEDVAKQLFANPSGADSLIAEGVSSDSKSSMLNIVVEDYDAQVDGVNRSMSDSTVYVTASTAEGGDVTYQISMVRDVLGWKISDVELYFPSQN